MATVLLVIPHFHGASYAYKHFIRPYITVNFQVGDSLLIPGMNDCLTKEKIDFLDATERVTRENGEEDLLDKVIIYEGESKPNDDTTESVMARPTSPKRIQKEWSCALCLVSTSNERSLREHLLGRKHREKLEELKTNEVLTNGTSGFSSAKKRSGRTILIENFDQIAWINLEKLSSLLSPVTRSGRWFTWRKPDIGWTKLNSDGSLERGNGSFGGLLRDNKGNPICGYVSKAPQKDIFLVELWAVWRGIVLALGLGIKVIWIESDSMSVVKTINKEQSYGPKASSCLKCIWELLKKFEKYKVSHSWRETNRAADHLSRMDVLGSDVVLWPVDFPNSLHKIIREDAQGKRYRRG
ncbi:unnamed protein product [Ilex paraguariensis]